MLTLARDLVCSAATFVQFHYEFNRSDETVINELDKEDSAAGPAGNGGRTGAESISDDSALKQRAREILAIRRKRYAIFGRAMFGEPAWDMLLLLSLSEATSGHMVSELVELAGASKSTGLRWIKYLESQRLISRRSHISDKRAEVVALSQRGLAAIQLYLSETLRDYP